MDTVSKDKRSEIMSKIRGKDTTPEKIVRSLLHSLGYRFRLHRKDLPGKPDIVLPKHKTVIFVHGCFWHSHEECKISHIPKSNQSYWTEKLKKNRDRDTLNKEKLSSDGWKVITIWECETKNEQTIIDKLEVLQGV